MDRELFSTKMFMPFLIFVEQRINKVVFTFVNIICNFQ